MKPGVHIQTPEGLSHYNQVQTMFEANKKNDMIQFFTLMLDSEIKRIDQELDSFLDDDIISKRYKMNDADVEGWHWWKVMSDYSATLRFFQRRGQYESQAN